MIGSLQKYGGNSARALGRAGFTVLAQSGIAGGVYGTDDELRAAGVHLVTAERVWAAPLVLRYKHTDAQELDRLHPGQGIGALFHAEGNPLLLRALISSGIRAYSYEFVHDGDTFPLASPGGEIAGVQAVLVGARALQHPAGRGVLIAAVTGATPAGVLIIGCGHVGAAAARTAAALGAQVTVLAHTTASADRYRTQTPEGVRVEINTPERLRTWLDRVDLVIGAILVSTHDTPPMITESDLGLMRPGAVIVDATCGYGAGYLPTAGPVQRIDDPPRVVRGILHVKVDTLPAATPLTTTQAYTTAIIPYLVRLANVVLRGAEDPVIASACIAADHHLVHPVCRQHAGVYGIPT
ncbi:MAG: hypothetical protein HKP61_18595 [Dactylosporangium sp.]|nr:hypothetical protein [Dactylosporangium sp.]NNJ62899.1 hypothetical protein [Dactylosporangium sp.]